MIYMAELNLYVYWNRMEEVQNKILELPIYPVVAGKNRHPVIRYLHADLFSLIFFFFCIWVICMNSPKSIVLFFTFKHDLFNLLHFFEEEH